MAVGSRLVLILGLALIGAPEAPAHHGSEDSPRGTLTVPSESSAEVPVLETRPGDRLQWTWTVVSGSPEHLLGLLAWTDAAGREQEFKPGPDGQTFGSLVAPDGFRDARLVWRNAGSGAVTIEWTYGASAPFWRRPDMFLPASIPVIFLVACYVVGRAIDRRARRLRAAAVAMDGGEMGAWERGDV
ncbi:MAG TPA: hypothetical protein VLD61_09835 [Methylomirabilota bacterium]|nr:hypothetical protein [Methylomirabilota bacterium]